jgi:hypothetical protein
MPEPSRPMEAHDRPSAPRKHRGTVGLEMTDGLSLQGKHHVVVIVVLLALLLLVLLLRFFGRGGGGGGGWGWGPRGPDGPDEGLAATPERERSDVR